MPEITLIVMALSFFAASLGKPKSGFLQGMALTLSAAAVLAAVFACGARGTMFFEAYSIDGLSQMFKVLITFGLFLVIYMGGAISGITEALKAEYYFFLAVSALGLVFMVSSVELITIVLALEISSFAIYVLIPFRRQKLGRSQMEAGIKYILFGAAATGITLYGMSYLFGLTHTTYLSGLAAAMPALIAEKPIAIIAMVMMLTGFFYKLALFPMHFWAPDVYEGAANETAGFVATLPKVGAVALLVRLITLTGSDITQFTWVLAAFAVISMTVGNLSALVQKDLKRLLAYSSIAHAGYMMVALLCADQMGSVAAVYYVAGYLLMNLACFFVIYNIAPEGGLNVTFEDLKGLHKRAPLLAFTLAAGAFGMAGIPPTIGFTGKFLIFTAALQKGLYALVILAVINAGISAFYYLKMVRAAYAAPHEETATAIPLTGCVKVLGVLFIALILLMGSLPQPFTQFVKDALAMAG